MRTLLPAVCLPSTVRKRWLLIPCLPLGTGRSSDAPPQSPDTSLGSVCEREWQHAPFSKVGGARMSPLQRRMKARGQEPHRNRVGQAHSCSYWYNSWETARARERLPPTMWASEQSTPWEEGVRHDPGQEARCRHSLNGLLNPPAPRSSSSFLLHGCRQDSHRCVASHHSRTQRQVWAESSGLAMNEIKSCWQPTVCGFLGLYICVFYHMKQIRSRS